MTTAPELAPPVANDLIARDIAALPSSALITRQGCFDVYLTTAKAIPNGLLEIGRLRELTYREVGVGSGLSRDLDRFDKYYLHLFLWDREKQQIGGAYRLGRTDQILRRYGLSGLYCGSLCECDDALLDYLNPGLELGRSWIQPSYQKSMSPLLGLWKGISLFVTRYPRYHKLFGAVSISDDYTHISQDIIVRFCRRNKMNPEWQTTIRALQPFENSPVDPSVGLQSIEEVSAKVSLNEPDGKGVPVLLRQYFKMNATLLEFAYDSNFQDCLEALVLVDLQKAPTPLLQRYMGKDGYQTFIKSNPAT